MARWLQSRLLGNVAWGADVGTALFLIALSAIFLFAGLFLILIGVVTGLEIQAIGMGCMALAIAVAFFIGFQFALRNLHLTGISVADGGIEFPRARFVGIVECIVLALAGLGVIGMSATDGRPNVAASAAAILVMVACIGAWLYRNRRALPPLSVNRDGIFDPLWRTQRIPWNDISDIRIWGTNNHHRALLVVLKDPSKYFPSKSGLLSRWRTSTDTAYFTTWPEAILIEALQRLRHAREENETTLNDR